MIIVRTKVIEFDLLKDSLFSDPLFGPILSDVTAGQKDDFLLHDKFLFKGNQVNLLCIPEGGLRLKSYRSYIIKVTWGVERPLNWCWTNSIGKACEERL